MVTPRLETDFAVKRTTTGKQLFRQVADIFDIRERWFFGLQFFDKDDKVTWLQPEERLTSRALHKDWPLHFTFCVRFWPQDSAWTLEEVAAELLFLQVRYAVLDGSLFCPLATAIELAAYALQALCGDFMDSRLESGQLTRNRHLPQKLEGPLRGSPEWQERVTSLHRRLHGLPRRDAMHEYLQRAQQLPEYGTTFTNIRCDHPLGGQPVGRRVRWFWMGVTPLGINVYEDKSTPLLRMPWEQLHSIRYEVCKFTIKRTDREKFRFITRGLKQSEELVSAIRGQKHAITMQQKNGESDNLSINASSDTPSTSSAENVLCFDWLTRGDSVDSVEEQTDHFAGQSPRWEESLEAAGWMDLVRHQRRQERKMSDNGCITRSSQAAPSLSHCVTQSLDSGLESWSDTATIAGAISGNAELAPHPSETRSSTASYDSVQFQLTSASDDVFA